MSYNYDPLNAIVTGGTKGIGLATARLFAQKGISLALCSRTQADLKETESILRQLNPDIRVMTFVCDVSRKEEVERFADFVLGEWKEIDVLVNNAGIFYPGEICTEAEGVLERSIETNLYSAYHLSRRIVSGMKQRRSGHIINLCSIASLIAYPNGGSYSISKFAMLGFSKVLREELKKYGIKVSSIMPGATWSDSWQGVDYPQSRLMQAEDIAKVICTCIELGESAVIEDIVIRPQLGDL